MALRVVCHTCGKGVRAGDDWAGRQAKCPKCGADIYFPKPEPVAAPVPASIAPQSREVKPAKPADLMQVTISVPRAGAVLLICTVVAGLVVTTYFRVMSARKQLVDEGVAVSVDESPAEASQPQQPVKSSVSTTRSKTTTRKDIHDLLATKFDIRLYDDVNPKMVTFFAGDHVIVAISGPKESIDGISLLGKVEKLAARDMGDISRMVASVFMSDADVVRFSDWVMKAMRESDGQNAVTRKHGNVNVTVGLGQVDKFGEMMAITFR